MNKVRSKLGLYGKGIKVAVIDSGIYYLHPALGGCFGIGCKVAFGYDLVGDNFGLRNSTTAPDNDPIDNCSTESHGTHVAGIIAAVANLRHGPFATPVNFTGVGPEITIGAYRVFGCSVDATWSDVIASAIYRAADDGADIISLSLGDTVGYSDEVDAVAASRTEAAGYFVNCANGNAGGSGIFSSGSPATGLLDFGVASFDNAQYLATKLYIGVSSYPYALGQQNGNFIYPERLNIFLNGTLNSSENSFHFTFESFTNYLLQIRTR